MGTALWHFTTKRTPTNIRYYDNEDLKLILNISLLNKHGYRIGCIAKMKPADINEAIRQIDDSPLEQNRYINDLTSSMIDMDEEGFEE